MAKTSSKFVPVVAAIALLAGVFSVASAHAAQKSCQSATSSGKPLCTTAAMQVAKNKTITGEAWAAYAGYETFATYKLYKNNIEWKSQLIWGYKKDSYTTDATASYRASIVAQGRAYGDPMGVKIIMSTP